ncbi:hypothetical protein CVH10_22225, partial [Halomonas sp. ND22Bw]
TYHICRGSRDCIKLGFKISRAQEPAGGDDVKGWHLCDDRWVGLVLSMIDSTDSSRAKGADNTGEAGLEEARLRQQAIGVKLRHMF